jgi:hypothetical protein
MKLDHVTHVSGLQEKATRRGLLACGQSDTSSPSYAWGCADQLEGCWISAKQGRGNGELW